MPTFHKGLHGFHVRDGGGEGEREGGKGVAQVVQEVGLQGASMRVAAVAPSLEL